MENQTIYNVHLAHEPSRPDWRLDEMQLEFDHLIQRGINIQTVLMENGRLKGKRIFTRAEIRGVK